VGIDIYAWLIDYELEQMSKYLDLIQASLSQRLDEVEVAYREDTAREMTDDEYERLDDHYTDEFLDTGRDFPQRLLSSFIIAWYSFVEQKLLDICEKLNLRISIGPKDSKHFGKGVRRARRFLLEASQYEIHPPHWQELVEIGRLRNFMVHKGTRVTGSYIESDEDAVALKSDIGNTFYFPIDQALFRYLQKYKLLDQSGMFLDIAPSFDYCNYLVEFGKELLTKIYTDLKPGR
jgi:hypothetical protein